MPDGRNVIPTRQETEELFVLPPVPTNSPPFLLAAGASVVMPPQPSDQLSLGKRIAGYSSSAFLAISNQPMTLVVEEANEPNGPFAVVETFTSIAAGPLQIIRERVANFGSYARVTLTNTGGPQAVLSFKGLGIPVV
jgi:hypothetical protein